MQSCPVSDSVALNLTLRHRWAHEASLLPFNTNSELVLNGIEALYACSHAQCQIWQCRICSTADSAALNLTLRHRWAHEASLLPFNTNSKLVLNGIEAVYACSHAQCQIWQCRICCTPDSALANLTLRDHWAHVASLLPFNTNSKLVLNGIQAVYACSHAQCQIRQC